MLAPALEHLVKGIVDKPADVHVVAKSSPRGEVLEVRVHPDDLGRVIGRPVLARLLHDEARLAAIEASFARNDVLALFVCQALPILPELACCLSGIARMNPVRFLSAYAVGVVPFAVIVAYAGSVSTIANPGPAIYAAIGVSASLLLAWRLLQRRARVHQPG